MHPLKGSLQMHSIVKCDMTTERAIRPVRQWSWLRSFVKAYRFLSLLSFLFSCICLWKKRFRWNFSQNVLKYFTMKDLSSLNYIQKFLHLFFHSFFSLSSWNFAKWISIWTCWKYHSLLGWLICYGWESRTITCSGIKPVLLNQSRTHLPLFRVLTKWRDPCTRTIIHSCQSGPTFA